MNSLATIFEVVVLSTTVVSVAALVGFIWSDAVADRRNNTRAGSKRAATPAQAEPQIARHLVRRRAKGERIASPKAA